MTWNLDRDGADFKARYGPWALIAGASEGIGAAFCEQLAGLGINLIIVARRPEPLEAWAAELRERFGIDVVVVSADLGRADIVAQLAASLEGREVGLLVYNACASAVGEFMEISAESRLASLNVNCRGPLLLLPELLPPMQARARGGVVLMASLSGIVGTAMVSTYAATKSFTQTLGEGLWEELGPQGIDVIVSIAGATSTPGFENLTPVAKRAAAYPMPATDVARDALVHLGAGPITVPGRLNSVVAFALQRLMGRAAAVRFMGRNTRGIYDKG